MQERQKLLNGQSFHESFQNFHKASGLCINSEKFELISDESNSTEIIGIVSMFGVKI